MASELQGRRVAILIAQRGTEQVEFEEPKKAVEEAGASVDVASDQTGEVQAVNNDLQPGDTFTVEKAFSEVSAEDYDALIVPGGAVGADELRGSEEAVEFVRGFFEQAKPVGGDLPRPVDPGGGGCGQGQNADLLLDAADRHNERGRGVDRPESRH